MDKTKTMMTLYHAFRYEIDKMAFPLALKEVESHANSTLRIIKCVADGYVVDAGLLFVRCGYVEGLYVLPKYRRRGVATKAVRDYLAEGGVIGRLDIINTNDAALRFWNSIFDLQIVRSDDVETGYMVAGVKDKRADNINRREV